MADLKKYPGIYRGTVFSNKDPLNQRRLRVIVPAILGDSPTQWAWPLDPSGVSLEPPAVKQGVWVMFENGDPSFPIWVGTFGKESSSKHKLYESRLNPDDVTSDITDLLELMSKQDGTKELDVTETLLNIVRNRYYGSFLYTGTQTAAVANQAYAIPINVTEASYGVSIVGGNTIRIQNTGTYNLAFSLQLTASNSSEHIVDIWLRHQGTDVAYSNSRVLFKGATIAAWNFFLESDTTPQDWQLMWASNSANAVSIATIAPQSPHPATPALILTVNKVK